MTDQTKSAARALIALLAFPASIAAQQPSAQASAQVTLRVKPTLAIRSVVPTSARTHSAGERTFAVIVNVESSLAYRISVRRPTSDARIRVLVRNAAGAFELLTPDASVVAVVSRTPDHRGHEIVCALAAPAPELLDGVGCDLIYELSAEYHDTLLRTTASLVVPPNTAVPR